MTESLGPVEKGTNPKEKMGRLKPDLSLIPQSALILEALAMMQGAEKYGPYNWRDANKKVQARTYIAAAMRHLAAWLDGEEKAPDSGFHHLAHARASLGVVMDAQVCGTMVDDRVPGVSGRLLEEYAIRTTDGSEDGTRVNLDNGSTVFVPAAGPPPAGVSIPRRVPDGAGGMTYMHGTDDEPCGSTFYIAGPMRGIPDFNFPAFDEARDRGRNAGYTIISPADMDREVGVDEETDIAEVDVRTFVNRDIGALLGLSPEKGDGIALLPGWEHSTGALAEIMVARWLGLRIISASTFGEYADGSPADAIARVVTTINDPPEDLG